MPLDAGDAMFLLMGASLVLPVGARLAGNGDLARRLDGLPRVVFAAVCLAVAFVPGWIFGRDGGGAAALDTTPVLEVRVLFSAMGSYLLARGLLRLWRRRRRRR